MTSHASVIHRAATLGNVADVRAEIALDHSMINKRDAGGDTPLLLVRVPRSLALDRFVLGRSLTQSNDEPIHTRLVTRAIRTS